MEGESLNHQLPVGPSPASSCTQQHGKCFGMTRSLPLSGHPRSHRECRVRPVLFRHLPSRASEPWPRERSLAKLFLSLEFTLLGKVHLLDSFITGGSGGDLSYIEMKASGQRKAFPQCADSLGLLMITFNCLKLTSYLKNNQRCR